MSILSEIGAWLLGVSAGTLSFLKNTIIALANNPQVQAVATEEVQKAEDAAVAAISAGNIMTGVQKFAAAQAGVVAQLTTAGAPVVMNQVNLAIEAAVSNLPAKTAAAPAPGAA